MRSVRSTARQESTTVVVLHPSVRHEERIIPIKGKSNLSAESSHDRVPVATLVNILLTPKRYHLNPNCRSPIPGSASPRGRLLFGRPSYPCCSTEDVAMRTFDPTPLWRSTVGFDRLFDLIDSSLNVAGDDNYPPYNIERTGEDTYHISVALAGFTPDEISVTAEQNMLTVEGRKADKGDHQYLYQGISGRPFRRQFS